MRKRKNTNFGYQNLAFSHNLSSQISVDYILRKQKAYWLIDILLKTIMKFLLENKITQKVKEWSKLDIMEKKTNDFIGLNWRRTYTKICLPKMKGKLKVTG